MKNLLITKIDLNAFFSDVCIYKIYKPLKTEVDILKTELNALKNDLAQLKQQANTNIWYDGADLKQLFNFSESTLIRYRKNNQIPFTKLGGRYFYPKSFFTKSLLKKMENKHLL